MAYYSLKAQFFVDSQGVAVPKAPPVPRRLARHVFERDGATCQKCGAAVRFGGNSVFFMDKLKSSACDHIFPRSRGGQNKATNLQLLCITCNSQKGAK
jgi:5-methylcytosine-specific restriction endonuclease McrA